MRRFIVLAALVAALVTACTSPNREHEDPADLCAMDPPPVRAVFRIDDDGDPKGWTGFVDGQQMHWTRYENGDPYSVTLGALQAKCYPGRLTAEACIAPDFDRCDCYAPDGSDADCAAARAAMNEYYRADAIKDGADSVH